MNQESDEASSDVVQHAADAPLPAAVARLVAEILTGSLGTTEAVDAAIAALSELGGTDRISVTLTLATPDEPDSWIRVGGRAWLKEWSNGNVELSVRGDSRFVGSDKALSLPWLSGQVTVEHLVALPDSARLEGVSDRDKFELERDNVHAMLAAHMWCAGVSYGSIGCSRALPGPWSDEIISTVRVLAAALGSRLSADRDRTVLAAAVERGDQVRESQQMFFSSLGHELRTPLTAIVGTAEAMIDEAGEMFEPTNPDDRNEASAGARSVETVMEFAALVSQDSRVVLSAGEQLLAVVNDLLNTGQQLGGSPDVGPVSAIDAVEDVVHWTRSFAITSNVTVTSEVDPVARVMTTPSALRQIMTNVIRNAIAYNVPGGSVRITTSKSVDDAGIDRVRISVHDTGRGLTTEQQREVFDPFVRFADAVPGTGLGLALSRSLAERDGGLLGVESIPGQGSSFWIDLPAAPR